MTEGGVHAAEALVLARYFMFTQVYFHKTRVAYDVHLRGVLKEVLPKGQFPPPLGEDLQNFLEWDDWKLLGLLNSGKGGEHGNVWRLGTTFGGSFILREVSTQADFETLEAVKNKLGKQLVAEEFASKSWYKTGSPDIPVLSDIGTQSVKPLSKFSIVVANLRANTQVFLYVEPQNVASGRKAVEEVMTNVRSA